MFPKVNKQHTLQGAVKKPLGHSKLNSVSNMANSSKESIIEAVESIIQYKFTNTDLLWEALHSRGMSKQIPGKAPHTDGNLRLAVLGDAVLQLCLAEDWYADGTKDRGKSQNRI